MSEEKHTPELWEHKLTMSSGYRIISSIGTTICWNVSSEANARLIAAAPEMLQVLKDTRDFLELEGFEKCATSVIDATIAKAEGGGG